MADNQTQLYQCGCGKSYTSYPAYSTHKKLKHQNQQFEGTQLPKQYIPKRGRPSFSLPNQPKNTCNAYTALTCAEIALLKLEEKYGAVLSEPSIDGDMNILQIYRDCDKVNQSKSGLMLVDAVKNFNQVIVNHVDDRISAPVTTFLQQLTLFLLKTTKNDQSQQQQRIIKFDAILFNRFFIQKDQKERSQEIARSAGKPFKFILDLTVALSEYLCKMNLSDSVLSLKQ